MTTTSSPGITQWRRCSWLQPQPSQPSAISNNAGDMTTTSHWQWQQRCPAPTVQQQWCDYHQPHSCLTAMTTAPALLLSLAAVSDGDNTDTHLQPQQWRRAHHPSQSSMTWRPPSTCRRWHILYLLCTTYIVGLVIIFLWILLWIFTEWLRLLV